MSSYYEKLLATGEVKCIDEEIPFEIPLGWEWCRIASLADVVRGGSPRPAGSPIFYDGSIPFLKVADLTRESSIYVKSFSSTIKEAGLSKTRLVEAGTLLLTNSGATLGVPKICTFETTFNDGVAAFLSLDERLKLYVYWFFCYMTDLYRKINQGTAQPNLNTDIIKMTLVPIPPYKEQIRIVEELGNISPIIKHYEKAQDELDELNESIPKLIKQSILQEAIRGKLVPQLAEEGTSQELLEQIKAEKQKLVKEGKLKKSALNDSVIFRGDDNKYYEQIGKKCVDITEDIPFSIPANWKWVRIRDVFQLNPKNEADNETLAAFIPMEKISAGYKSDFTFDLVKWGNIKKGFTHFANGDVAFAKITPCFQNRKSAIFHDLPNGIGAGTTELKVLRPYGNTIDRWYLLYFLESPHFIDEATFKGTANQQRIVVGYLEDKLFPLPTQKEQQRIVAQIEKLFEQLR